jgi:hypothetical protein
MKKTAYFPAIALFSLCSAVAANALAESLTKASPKDVSMLLEAATGKNSAYRAILVGETSDRVYFEYMTGIHAASSFSNRPKRVVYWTPRSAITNEQLAQFKTYKDRVLPER